MCVCVCVCVCVVSTGRYPKGKQRAKILTKVLREEGGGPRGLAALLEISERRIRQIADRTEDFSPADLRRVVKDARNLIASKLRRRESESERAGGAESAPMPVCPGDELEEAVEQLRRMRDEVESFMKQMYH